MLLSLPRHKPGGFSPREPGDAPRVSQVDVAEGDVAGFPGRLEGAMVGNC